MAEYYVGKFGQVIITDCPGCGSDGIYISVKDWSATHTIQELDTTSTNSAGLKEVQGGIETLEGKLSGDWQTDNDNYGPFTGYNFFAGNYVSLILQLEEGIDGGSEDSSDAVGFVIPYAFVRTCDVKAPVNGTVAFDMSWIASGDFTIDNVAKLVYNDQGSDGGDEVKLGWNAKKSRRKYVIKKIGAPKPVVLPKAETKVVDPNKK